MTYVVTEPCIKCKYKDCVDPCPVDCFHEGEEFLVIDPDVCIDCAVCVTACPVQAIYQDREVPPAQSDFIEINRRLSAVWPAATNERTVLGDREEWRSVEGKRSLLPLLGFQSAPEEERRP